jgi:hypothetical protein
MYLTPRLTLLERRPCRHCLCMSCISLVRSPWIAADQLGDEVPVELSKLMNCFESDLPVIENSGVATFSDHVPFSGVLNRRLVKRRSRNWAWEVRRRAGS